MPLDLGTRELETLWETCLKDPKVLLGAGADTRQRLDSALLGIQCIAVCSSLVKIQTLTLMSYRENSLFGFVVFPVSGTWETGMF